MDVALDRDRIEVQLAGSVNGDENTLATLQPRGGLTDICKGPIQAVVYAPPGHPERDTESTMRELASIDWADAFSRLHPVILHLPIGLLLSLAWLQVWRRFSGSDQEPGPTRAPLVFLLVLSAPGAALSGWLLREGGGYADPVSDHQYFGLALAIVTIGIGCAHLWRPAWYSRLLWLGVLLLGPTAHLGGTLTHGEGFLTAPWLKPRPTAAVLEPEAAAVRAPTFAEVLPIFDEFCSRCHGLRRQRADLALDSLQALLRGGESGPVVVAGHPEESILLRNLRLPSEDDLHMPPPRKNQPTQQQIALIEAWIAAFGGEAQARGQASPGGLTDS